VKGSGDRRDEQGLGNAGWPFEQQVPGARHLVATALLEGIGNTAEQADQHLADQLVLADDDRADLLLDAVNDVPGPLVSQCVDSRPFHTQPRS
jgi:hypothetical protein